MLYLVKTGKQEEKVFADNHKHAIKRFMLLYGQPSSQLISVMDYFAGEKGEPYYFKSSKFCS